ncbi:MAG: carotenoid biosynthesis protein [Actinomycetes bacterium]
MSVGLARRTRPSGAAVGLTWLLAGTTVAAQIAYPLVEGAWLHRVTVATVVLFFTTCVVHALAHRGPAWTLGLVAVTAGGGLAAEAVGVRTGLPFGDYRYEGTLGPEVLGVPVVVPLAWTMMAYPVLLAARRLTRHWVPVVGGFGLVAWDVFLDPQMVGDGHWTWLDPEPALPGVDGVPLSNFAGWAAVGVLMMLVLTALLPRDRADESVPAALLVWTWVGYVIGNVFWFGTTSVAVVGGLLLGALVVPYAWSLWQARP